MQVWNAERGECVRSMEGHTSAILCMDVGHAESCEDAASQSTRVAQDGATHRNRSTRDRLEGIMVATGGADNLVKACCPFTMLQFICFTVGVLLEVLL